MLKGISMLNTPLHPPGNNGDAELQIADPTGASGPHIVGLGSFHKTLAHNDFGEVNPEQFEALRTASGSALGNYAGLDKTADVGSLSAGHLVNPMASLARESHGPDPLDMSMLPAPGVRSASTAAEMIELYHMALLRDLPFHLWDGNADVTQAVDDTRLGFQRALAEGASPPGAGNGEDGRLRLVLGLPAVNGQLAQTAQSLFRCGLPNESVGPLVSQFFLHDAAYGTQLIQQKQFAYASGVDYLKTKAHGLHAQRFARSVGTESNIDAFEYGRANERDAAFEGGSGRGLHRIRNLRDLARFVHKDALHQAYFNAALLLLSWQAPADVGNPYRADFGQRQIGFGTLGAPHLLTLVSEVASRALKAVWRQKWGVHLRQRPEAYAGALEMERRHDRPYGLLAHFTGPFDALLQRIGQHNGTDPDDTGGSPRSLFLPMAFESGSPAHPAYGAGHATMAGACVTILKSWFDESAHLVDVLTASRPRHPVSHAAVHLVQPGKSSGLPSLPAAVARQLTVGGELNKLASNVALGRSMGGVHWRSDNTRSLRLGEQIATIMLRRQCRDHAEPGLNFSYCSFDGHAVKVHPNGQVTVEGDPALERFYSQPGFGPRS